MRAYDLPGDKHAVAYKVSNEMVARLVIQVIGRIPLHDAALVHYANFIAKCECVVLIMRHHHAGCAVFLQHIGHFLAHMFTQL